MATAANSSCGTVCEEGTSGSQQEQEEEQRETTLKLKLKKVKKDDKKIHWTEDTVDNEGLGRKKSKCCCQYTKPKKDLDESSSDSEDDCENCSGHTPSDTTKH